jgi:hypothetical protein
MRNMRVFMGVLGILSLSGAAMASKPGTVAPVPLIVEVDDVTPGQRITSDGAGPYEDGVDGVAASIDQYGNLIINFQTTRSALRKLHYDYSEPIIVHGGTMPSGIVAPPNNYLSTIRQSGDTRKMQQLAVNESQCILGGPSYTLEDANKTQYRHAYQRGGLKGIDPAETGQTAFLKVTRTGQDTWVVESTNTCNEYSDVAQIVETPTVGKFNFKSRGLYRMPFRLFLTRKQ